jgi:hypothetical protein
MPPNAGMQMQQPQMQQPQMMQQQGGFQQQPQQNFQQQQAFGRQTSPQGQAPGDGFQMPQVGNMFLNASMAAAASGDNFNQAMGNVAMQEGMRALQGTGVSRWFPALYMSLQGQFNVGQSFVMRKLMLLLCPFVKQNQASPSYDDTSPGPGNQAGPHLKVDINEPDLYIPLMSYFTYCLVYCVQKGINNDFKPEVMAGTISFAMVMYILEVIAAKMGFFVAGSPVKIIELMGTCGYKFVHVLLMVLIRIGVGSSYLYYVFFAYLAAASGFALRRFMSRFEATHNAQYGVQPNALHGQIILGLAISQIPLCWLLTPSMKAVVE